jgi:hypothetical protein
MKSIKSQLIAIATVVLLGAHATAALAQSPAHTPNNNNRHAQTVGGDGAPLHTKKNNTRQAQEAGGGQGTHGARSPEKNQANNAYKYALKNGQTPSNKPQKPQKPKRPQQAQ